MQPAIGELMCDGFISQMYTVLYLPAAIGINRNAWKQKSPAEAGLE
jgi:hypothetical protein